uniref:Centrosomal protein 170Aa n=1 Tax=Scleropages formosus TaxID=113540 RepID=A0A8D0CHT9_SCLFO
MSLTSWFLVSSGGTRHRLPREMIFVGRDDCELMLQSRSVDKQHAVINYEASSDEHKVKDLGSLNGTFVNDVRIQEQMYITLKIDDKLRFGYDILSETQPLNQGLHEKFTSQLQLSKQPSSGESSKSIKSPGAKPSGSKPAEAACESVTKSADPHKVDDKIAGDMAAVHRGTPLYGQPSWWGDGDADDENSFKQESKTSGKKQESCAADSKEPKKSDKVKEEGLEPSYFEIPTKETPVAESTVQEVPTKDTAGVADTLASAQGHASFTIEFDDTSPGKVTIRDHVSKFTPDHRPRPRRSPQQAGRELTSLQAAIMASETKVADWLAQNDPPRVRRESTEEDSKSIKSDVPVHLKRLKGSKHEDGTQSDSENGAGLRFGSRRQALEERLRGLPASLVSAAPTAARLLLKQRSEDPGLVRGSAGVGQQFSPTDDSQRLPRSGTKENDDDQSDKGTYTIELENHNPEEEEARRMIDKVRPVLPVLISGFSSLAANHTRTDPEGSGADSPAFVHQEKEADASESGISIKSVTSTSSQGERKRRTLPQLPTEDKPPENLRVKSGKGSAVTGLRSEIGEKQDTEPQEKESQSDPKGRGTRAGSRGVCGSFPSTEVDVTITSKQAPQQEARLGISKPPVRPVGSGEKRTEERRRRTEDRATQGKSTDGMEKSGKPLVRQGSFTIEKPSANVPIELIPRINKQAAGPPLPRDRSDSVGSMDTATLLKDTEAVMAFLEAKLRNENKLDAGNQPPKPRAGSISPESDVDTASTVSQAAGESDRKAAQKRRTLSSLHKEKGPAVTRERLEKKAKARPSDSRMDPRRAIQVASRARQPSLDLTDDDQTSSLPHSTISDVLSSDQETYSGRSHGRGAFTSTDELLHSKLEAGKASKTAQAPSPANNTSAASGKPATLPRPRPTRASLLRRARLGDTSDTDLADADRVSVASEVSTTSSTSRPPSGRKAPSRIDMLAQPRRTRLGSMSARSDSEATMSRAATTSRAAAAAETALRLGLRTTSIVDGKVAPRVRANSVSKLPDAKSKVTYSVHGSPSASSRWRRLPPEYASTSEDEFGSNRNSPKHGRLRPGTTLRTARLSGSAPATPGPVGGVMKQRMRDQEDYIRDWTAHSEEIARYSSDLAILAREIHDVAGEIDSVSSSGTAPSTTVSTAATTPGSAIDTREELVDRVFDESLNFRKIPPVVQTKAPEINGRPVELRPRAPGSQDPQAALRRRTWNRDEAVLDSLLLTSVSQLSAKIRQSVDKTAGKIRILFKDKDRNWEEIESKLRAESDMPLLKTSNKEISSILLELKRVEKQLQVINIMVDPDGTLDALTSLGLTSPTLPQPKTSPGIQGPQGPLPGNGTSRAPPASAESEQDFTLRFGRLHPSGEESPLSHK